MRLLLLMTLGCYGVTLAHADNLPPLQMLQSLHDAESFKRSKLAPIEVKQILRQVKATAFEIPKSWQKELRARPISLQRITTDVAQHMGMSLEAECCLDTCAFNHPCKASRGKRRTTLGREHERRLGILFALKPPQCPGGGRGRLHQNQRLGNLADLWGLPQLPKAYGQRA
jgi:hypothetical protein